MLVTEDGSSSRDSGATSDMLEVACTLTPSEEDDNDADEEAAANAEDAVREEGGGGARESVGKEDASASFERGSAESRL